MVSYISHRPMRVAMIAIWHAVLYMQTYSPSVILIHIHRWTVMSSEVVHCYLCDRRERGARSKVTTVGTVERQQKIYDGYQRLHVRSLNYPLVDKKVHASCYRAVTFGLSSVSDMKMTGRPKRYQHPPRVVSEAISILLNLPTSPINDNRNYLHQNQQHSTSAQLNLDIESIADCRSLSDPEVRSSEIFTVIRMLCILW